MNVLDIYETVYIDDGVSPEFPLDIVFSGRKISSKYITAEGDILNGETDDDFVLVPMFEIEDCALEDAARRLLMNSAMYGDKMKQGFATVHYITLNNVCIAYDTECLVHVIGRQGTRHGLAVLDTGRVWIN